MALTIEERIKKLRDKYEYKSDQLIKNEGWGGLERAARAKENMKAKRKREWRDEIRAKMKRQKAGGKIGKAKEEWMTGEGKKEKDRARHMKLVLGDDWKPSDDTWTGRQKILKNMDKRDRALDPENDQGFLSGLRNKMNIMPTQAEAERRLMARNNARAEQARLSEGEAGGALAGSAAERIREARKVREAKQRDEAFQKKRHEDYQKFRSGRGALEVAEEPTIGGLEDLGTESLRERVNKDARVKDYKDFSDEAALLRRERAMRGEGGITQAEDSEQALKEALPFARAAEREKYGGVGSKMLEERHKREKGLMNIGGLPPSERAKLELAEAGGERMSFDDPSIAGRGSWRGKEEELGGKSIPFTEAMKEEIGGKSLDLNDPENRELLRGIAPEKAGAMDMADDEFEMDQAKKAKRDESILTAEGDFEVKTQEEAQQAIREASPENQKAISEEIANVNGMGSDAWVESKEATGNYVRYEGSGLVINMSALGKDIKRNENMAMLKHIPMANRAAMLVEWGYIDPDDLSIAQKQSAKEVKELSLLDLRIAKTQGEIEKNKNKLGEKDKIRYQAATRSMQDALKNGQYGLAEVYRNELNSISPTGDTSNFQELIAKGIERGKIRTPEKVFKAAGIKGDTYYNAARSIAEKVNFLRNPSNKAARTSKLDQLFGQTAIDPVTGQNKGTYGEFLKNQGIYLWKDVKGPTFKAADFLKQNPKAAWALDSEESYMKWALPQIQDKLLTGIFGNIHQQVQQYNGKQFETAKKKAADGVIRMRQPWEIGGDEGKVDPALQKAADEVDLDSTTAPATQPASVSTGPPLSDEEQKRILQESLPNIPLGIRNDPAFAVGEWVGEGLIKIGNLIYNVFSEEGQEKLKKQLDSLGKGNTESPEVTNTVEEKIPDVLN